MIVATDFDELVFSCGELLINDPEKLILELVNTVESNSHYAAATSFAILHASFDLDLPQERVALIFSLASQECTPKRLARCTSILADIEEAYYSNYMDEYEGKPVFASPSTLQ